MPALGLWLMVSLGCGRGEDPEPGRGAPASAPEPSQALFVDGSAEAGLDFVHFNGMSGEHYYVEMMGGGAAFFDYDNDDDLDLYLIQGHMLGRGKTLADATFPPQHPEPFTDRLYRNDLVVGEDGSRQLRFTDVTEESGIEAYGYGMGVAAGDIDNDGWVDLYVTNSGPNQMLRNNGDGTFSDVTRESRTDDPRWSVAAAFFDYDRDGWLDLYVGNYVDYTLATHQVCLEESGAVTYCGPLSEAPEPDRLLRNRGDGTFEDVTEEALPGAAPGATLGVISADFNLDGWIDIYVTIDAYPNQLWINQGDGSFRDDGLLSGAAVNMQGSPEGSMGVSAGDIDADGDEDLIMTHIDRETNTVYVNDGQGNFEDITNRTGVGSPSWDFTGFGVSWFDYDNDGWLDLLVLNGAVYDLEEQVRVKDPFPIHQRNHLYHALGGGVFEEVSGRAGPVFSHSEVSRGAAFGDVDNDGDTDVLVFNNGGPARLLVNQVGQDRRWLGLRLIGDSPPRYLLGSWVGVFRDEEPTLWKRVRRDGSYASASDPRLLFGLGDSSSVDRVRVWWPDGTAEEWTEVALGRYTTLRPGSGRPIAEGSR